MWAESIEWFIEDQLSCSRIWLLPRHLSHKQVVLLPQSSCVSPVELTDVRGAREEPNHTTARKHVPLYITQYSLDVELGDSSKAQQK
jgi:hypothetical protein